jgi:hypothetical protein
VISTGASPDRSSRNDVPALRRIRMPPALSFTIACSANTGASVTIEVTVLRNLRATPTMVRAPGARCGGGNTTPAITRRIRISRSLLTPRTIMLPSANGASTGNAIDPPAIIAVMNAQSRPLTIFMSR